MTDSVNDVIELKNTILDLKKELRASRAENQALKVKIRKLTNSRAGSFSSLDLNRINFRDQIKELEEVVEERNSTIRKLQHELKIFRLYKRPDQNVHRFNAPKTRPDSNKRKAANLRREGRTGDAFSIEIRTISASEEEMNLQHHGKDSPRGLTANKVTEIASFTTDAGKSESSDGRPHEQVRMLQMDFMEMISQVRRLREKVALSPLVLGSEDGPEERDRDSNC